VRLPTGSTLELDETSADLVIDRTDPVAPSDADVLALLPAWARQADAPIRDAIVAAFRAIANRAWAQVGQILERFASPRFAEGAWLDSLWGELLKRSRTSSETDGEYRARLLGTSEIVSPTAIRTAIDRIVRDGVISPPAFLETATDAMFLAPGDGSTVEWGAWWQPRTKRLWAKYGDNPNRTIGAYIVPGPTAAGWRAEFFVVLPGTGTAGEPCMSLGTFDPSWPVDPDHDFLAPGDGSTVEWGAFLFEAGESLLERVRSDVESRRAAGVVWLGFYDPLLDAAV
jgi:hypothetical protein